MSNTWKPTTALGHSVSAAGFWYDPEQDIIFSKKQCLQRKLGYCWTYDETAPTISSNITCEPIYFNYNNASWMIEFWKGQYGMETGAEIGIYKRKKLWRWQNPKNHFYHCAKEADELEMSFLLYDLLGSPILGRDSKSEDNNKHWWLTGFKWGAYTNEPDRLKMVATIRLPAGNQAMYDAVSEGFSKAGYNERNGNYVNHRDNSFTVTIQNPFMRQPALRALSSKAINLYNKNNCELYNRTKQKYGYPYNDPNVLQDYLTGVKVDPIPTPVAPNKKKK